MESIGMNFSAAEALRRITHKLKKKEKENKSNQSFTPFVIDWWIVCLSSSAEEKKRMKNNQFSKRIVVLLRQFTPSILKKEWTAVQVGFAGHHSLHFHLISLPSIKWMGSVLPLYSASAIFNQHSILKEFHLWLLDSYPLHINYCYNINSNQLISSFISINKAKQSNFFDWIAGWWMKERSWWNWVALQLKSKTFQITPWAGRPTKPTLHSTHFNSFNSFHSATAWARGPSIPQRTTQSIECLHSVHSIQFKLACFAPFTNHFFFKEAKATRRSSSLY